MPAGHLRLDGAFSLTRGEDQRRLSCAVNLELCLGGPLPDHDQEQSFLSARWLGSAVIGLGKGWQFELSLPFELKRSTLTYALPDGAPYLPPYTTLATPSGTSAGIGDARPLLRLAGRIADSPTILGVALGAMLPTGRVGPNPFDETQPAAEREHRQFGNGTFDPIAEGSVVLGTRPAGFVLGADVRLPLYANRFGYRGSFVLRGTLGLLLALPAPVEVLHLRMLLRATHTGAARWDGEVALNSGRDDLASVIGVEGMIRQGLALRGELAANVLEQRKGEQFSLPVTVSFGISGVLDLTKRRIAP